MTQILNLDQISTTEDKVITLKGEKHSFKPLSVGEYIAQVKRIENLDASKAKGSDDIEHSLDMITASFPTLTREILLSLSADQLAAIGKFVRGEIQTESNSAVTDAPTPAAGDEGNV